MKQLILSFFILTLSACGVIKEACHPTDLHCEFLFGRHDARPQENADEILQLTNTINGLLGVISGLSAQAAANESQITALESMIYDVQADIAELEMHAYVTELIDPCGPSAGFDEVLIRLSSGELIAYFENGGKRFLTVLSPGNYQTTDSQACVFTLDSSFNVID